MKWAIAAAWAVALSSQAVAVQAEDPAIGTVQTLNDGLVSIMRAGAKSGLPGRKQLIGPVIDRAFDLPLMTRLAVGPTWTGLSAKDQAELVRAFRAMTIAQYARNFNSFSGERFDVAAKVEARGSDKLVRTTLVSPRGSSESLNYRLRNTSGTWKIVDVYYRNSISQLATRRSDFARILTKGGASALITHVNQLAARPE